MWLKAERKRLNVNIVFINTYIFQVRKNRLVHAIPLWRLLLYGHANLIKKILRFLFEERRKKYKFLAYKLCERQTPKERLWDRVLPVIARWWFAGYLRGRFYDRPLQTYIKIQTCLRRVARPLSRRNSARPPPHLRPRDSLAAAFFPALLRERHASRHGGSRWPLSRVTVGLPQVGHVQSRPLLERRVRSRRRTKTRLGEEASSILLLLRLRLLLINDSKEERITFFWAAGFVSSLMGSKGRTWGRSHTSSAVSVSRRRSFLSRENDMSRNDTRDEITTVRAFGCRW